MSPTRGQYGAITAIRSRDQIRGGDSWAAHPRAQLGRTPGACRQPGLTHQPSDPLAIRLRALLRQFRVDAGRSRDLPTLATDGPYLLVRAASVSAWADAGR